MSMYSPYQAHRVAEERTKGFLRAAAHQELLAHCRQRHGATGWLGEVRCLVRHLLSRRDPVSTHLDGLRQRPTTSGLGA